MKTLLIEVKLNDASFLTDKLHERIYWAIHNSIEIETNYVPQSIYIIEEQK